MNFLTNIYKIITNNKLINTELVFIDLDESYQKMLNLNWTCPNSLQIYKFKIIVSTGNPNRPHSHYEINEIFIPNFGISINNEYVFFPKKDRYTERNIFFGKEICGFCSEEVGCKFDSITTLEGETLNHLFNTISGFIKYKYNERILKNNDIFIF